MDADTGQVRIVNITELIPPSWKPGDPFPDLSVPNGTILRIPAGFGLLDELCANSHSAKNAVA